MTLRAIDRLKTCGGFSLAELALVVGIVSLTAALSWPSLRQYSRSLSLRAAADSLADRLGDRREAAVFSGKPQTLTLYPNARLFRVAGVPSFNPDGSATPFEAHFGQRSKESVLVWVSASGEIHVEAL
jgi:Tfp pilus assembly protein FimT